MKKYLPLFIILLTLLITPLYANTTKTIYLNDILYKPLHKVLFISPTTYISLDDLNALTYGSVTQDGTSLSLDLNGNKIQTAINSRIFKINNETFTLSAPILSLENTIYLPTDLFPLLNETYIETADALYLTTPIPYSSTTDHYGDHELIASSPLQLIDLVKEASASPAEGEQMINDAIKNNHYLIVPLKSPSPELFNTLKTTLQVSKPMEIIVREADFLNKTPTLSSLKTLPITCSLEDQKLALQINNTTLSSTCFEAAFNPNDSANMIDSHKTLDALLMRLIYTYYLDYYQLKDDVHFLPVAAMEMKRSDTMHFKVYLDQVINSTPATYDMIISKQIHTDRISYIVDFMKLS